MIKLEIINILLLVISGLLLYYLSSNNSFKEYIYDRLVLDVKLT